jgi:heme A synthase
MLKWIAIIFVGAMIFMIATGNMGGAKKATKNYNTVMRGGK